MTATVKPSEKPASSTPKEPVIPPGLLDNPDAKKPTSVSPISPVEQIRILEQDLAAANNRIAEYERKEAALATKEKTAAKPASSPPKNFAKSVKGFKIDATQLATEVSRREGGHQNLPISEVAQVLKIGLDVMAEYMQTYGPSGVLELVERHVH